MTALPNTKTRGAGRRWPIYVLMAVALVALWLVVESFLRAEGFTPGEEIVSPNIRDVSVSAENRLYPPPDVNYFGERPETIYVYLSVEDLPTGEDMRARVQRSGSGSAFSLFFGRDEELEAVDEQEDQSGTPTNAPPARATTTARSRRRPAPRSRSSRRASAKPATGPPHARRA